jgi:hypothetical protein
MALTQRAGPIASVILLCRAGTDRSMSVATMKPPDSSRRAGSGNGIPPARGRWGVNSRCVARPWESLIGATGSRSPRQRGRCGRSCRAHVELTRLGRNGATFKGESTPRKATLIWLLSRAIGTPDRPGTNDRSTYNTTRAGVQTGRVVARGTAANAGNRVRLHRILRHQEPP